MPLGYDVFISYSHAADQDVAIALERGLERLAKPWHKRRSLDVFRDDSELGVNPHLWSSIETALTNSDWYLVLASPEAAESEWVAKEASAWLEGHDADQVLVALTGGHLEWDETRTGFDPERTTALPPVLLDLFDEEPRYLDFRWAHSETDLDLQNAQFMAAVADLAAPVHGVSKGELIGEDVRQYKRTRRLAWGALALVLTLAITAGVAGLVAFLANERLGRTLSDLDAAEIRLSDAEAAEDAAQRATQAADLRRQEADAAAAAADEAAAEAQRAREAADAAKDQAEIERRQADAQATVAASQAAAAQRKANAAEALATQAEQSLDDAKRALADANDAADQAADEAADARRQRDRAESDAIAIDLATKVPSLINSSPAVAHLLAVQSDRFATRLPNAAATNESAGALVEVIFSNPGVEFFLDPGLGAVNDAVVSPAGILVTASVDGDIGAWDLNRPDAPAVYIDAAPLDSKGPFVHNIAMSPDGRRIAYAREIDNQITVVEIDANDSPQRILTPGDRKSRRDVALAGRDGNLLVVGTSGSAGAIHLRDLRTDSSWETFGNATRELAVSANGKLIAASNSTATDGITVWRVEPGGPTLVARLRFSHDAADLKAIVGLEFIPAQEQVVAVDRAARVLRWDVGDCNEPEGQFCLPHAAATLEGINGGDIERVAVDARHIAVATQRTVIRGHVDVLNTSDLGPTDDSFTTSYGVLAVAFSDDGQRLITGGRRNRLEVRSLALSDAVPPERVAIASRRGNPAPFAVSPQGDLVLGVAADSLHLISIDGSTVETAELENPHPGRVTAMGFSGDAELAASVDDRARLVVWQVVSGRLERIATRSVSGVIDDLLFGTIDDSAWIAPIPSTPRRDLDIWPLDGDRAITLDSPHDIDVAASASNGLLMLAGPKRSASAKTVALSFWDPLAAGEPRPDGVFVDIDSAGAKATSLAPDPRGTLAALGMSDGRIHLIDIATRQQLAPVALSGKETIVSVALSDRGLLAAASAAGDIGVWDTSTGRMLGRLKGDREIVEIQIVDTGSGFVIRALDSRDLNTWAVVVSDLRERACRRANRNLTAEEWRIHIGDARPYEKTCGDLA